jgi:hypothetical protein
VADSFTPKNPNAKGQYAWSNSVSWSTGAPPDQNTAAILNSTAVGYTLLIDGADTANAITFGSGSGWLSIQIAGGDTLKANSGGNVAGGSTVTFAASSAGSFTTNGFEVHAGGTLNMLGGTFSANGSGLTLDDGSNTTFGTQGCSTLSCRRYRVRFATGAEQSNRSRCLGIPETNNF